MLGSFRRRSVAVVATAALSLTMGATPALAHFCMKDFGSGQGANAANGKAWQTAAETRAFAEADNCDMVMVDAFLAAHEGYLFMGPGLLARGTSPIGKANGETPKKIAYIPFSIFATCGG